MANLKPSLRQHLLTKNAITQVVSARVYPDQVPQRAVLPYVTISRISHGHEHHMGGASGLARAGVQVDCYTTTAKQSDQLSEAIRDAIDGFAGSMGSLDVRDCFLTDEGDEFIPPTDKSERGKFRNRMDFTIWHAETVPNL